MKSRVIRFGALGILLCLVGVALSPKAIACLNNSRTTTYYAWAPTANSNPGPNDVCCGGPCIISPQQPYDRRAVGGKTVDCDGTVTTWGFNPMCGDNETVTTSCPACGG
jgi:hypothetical protein